MYTTQENVRIVISLLKEYNIHHIVLNPGVNPRFLKYRLK